MTVEMTSFILKMLPNLVILRTNHKRNLNNNIVHLTIPINSLIIFVKRSIINP